MAKSVKSKWKKRRTQMTIASKVTPWVIVKNAASDDPYIGVYNPKTENYDQVLAKHRDVNSRLNKVCNEFINIVKQKPDTDLMAPRFGHKITSIRTQFNTSKLTLDGYNNRPEIIPAISDEKLEEIKNINMSTNTGIKSGSAYPMVISQLKPIKIVDFDGTKIAVPSHIGFAYSSKSKKKPEVGDIVNMKIAITPALNEGEKDAISITGFVSFASRPKKEQPKAKAPTAPNTTGAPEGELTALQAYHAKVTDFIMDYLLKERKIKVFDGGVSDVMIWEWKDVLETLEKTALDAGKTEDKATGIVKIPRPIVHTEMNELVDDNASVLLAGDKFFIAVEVSTETTEEPATAETEADSDDI